MLSDRKGEQQLQNQAIIELTNDEQNYMTRNRKYGEGEIRIGSTFTLSEDIYCIGFIC